MTGERCIDRDEFHVFDGALGEQEAVEWIAGPDAAGEFGQLVFGFADRYLGHWDNVAAVATFSMIAIGRLPFRSSPFIQR